MVHKGDNPISAYFIAFTVPIIIEILSAEFSYFEFTLFFKV